MKAKAGDEEEPKYQPGKRLEVMVLTCAASHAPHHCLGGKSSRSIPGSGPQPWPVSSDSCIFSLKAWRNGCRQIVKMPIETTKPKKESAEGI